MGRKGRLFCGAALLLSALVFAGCGAPGSSSGEKREPSADRSLPEYPVFAPEDSVLPETQTKAERILQEMTLREKVGQLLIVRPDALDPEQVQHTSAEGVTALSASMVEILHQYPVGGVVIFGKNITDETQLVELIDDLQEASTVPLFLAVDEEGGSVARLGNHAAFDVPHYQSAAAVGASGDSADAREMGMEIGSYLQRYHFNMDFAPVADVNTNPDTPVIGNRAFSSEPDLAAEMARAMADGLQEAHIIPVFKHFPGHGDTAQDSHSTLAVSNKTWAELESCEWLPYQRLTQKDCVMVGHIALPNVTGTQTLASLSEEIVSGILRGALGFDGVILTDSLEMGAICKQYTPAEAAVLAIEAGCDLILGPEDLREAFAGVLDAVETGRIGEARLEESVLRILNLKEAYGCLD